VTFIGTTEEYGERERLLIDLTERLEEVEEVKEAVKEKKIKMDTTMRRLEMESLKTVSNSMEMKALVVQDKVDQGKSKKLKRRVATKERDNKKT